MWGWGFLEGRRYVILDRDPRFSAAFREILKSSGLKIIRLPPYSPNLNSHAKRWVLSVKTDVLSRLVLFDEAGLRKALKEYLFHYHSGRNHQGKHNELLFPQGDYVNNSSEIKCEERLGGLLKFYYRNRERTGADENIRSFCAQ